MFQEVDKMYVLYNVPMTNHLSIFLAKVKEEIVILPVHDGNVEPPVQGGTV